MQVSWNVSCIILSFAISLVGSYTAVSLSEQFRVSTRLGSKMKVKTYLVLMAISIGGGAIWCMHFVGMAAQRLKHNGEYVDVMYDPFVTLASLVSSITSVYIGLYIATSDRMYTKSEQEIVQILSEKASLVNIAVLQNPYYLWKLAILNETLNIAIGGVISGGGVCIMHYVGMIAMMGPFEMHWNYGLVMLSVCIACVAATAAFWILFRLLALYPRKEWLRISSAATLSMAVCGMHYTAAAAASFEYSNNADKSRYHRWYVDANQAVMIAVVGGLTANWFMTLLNLSDLRSWHYSLASSLRAHRERIATLTLQPERLLRQSVNMAEPHTQTFRTNPSGGQVCPDVNEEDDECLSTDMDAAVCIGKAYDSDEAPTGRMHV